MHFYNILTVGQFRGNCPIFLGLYNCLRDISEGAFEVASVGGGGHNANLVGGS